MRTRAELVVIGVFVLAGCSTGTVDETTSASTTTPPDTTSETTVPATTTTAVATTTTTTAPRLTARGLVWESNNPALINAVDGRPTTDVDGVTSAIDMVLVLGADEHDFCRDQADRYREIYGGELADQCLVVVWRYDVADDFRTDQYSPQAGLFGRSIVTADGRQYDSVFGSQARPGTIGNTTDDTFPHGGVGTTIYWGTGSNLVGWTEHSYTVPDDLPVVVLD